MRNAAGLKSGVVRSVNKYGINEATYFEGKGHGLSFLWYYDNTFVAYIFEHDKEKAFIWWNKDWSEDESSGNKALLIDIVTTFKR